MENEEALLKKSFFKEYFLYKLKGFRGMIAGTSVLNFICAAGMGIAFYVFVNLMVNVVYNLNDNSVDYDNIMYNDFFIIASFKAVMLIIMLVAAASMVIAAVTAVTSFKFYNNKSSTDTLGALPLTYRQRFWGDFLSGLFANLVSYIPFSAIGLIFMAAAQNGPLKQVQRYYADNRPDGVGYIVPEIADDFTGFAAKLLITLFVTYIGIYIVSGFVASCCGRVSSSIIFSALAMLVAVGIVAAYSIYLSDQSVGIGHAVCAMNAISGIPPLGFWVGLLFRIFYFNFFGGNISGVFDVRFGVTDPLSMCLTAAVLAVLLIGAYFLGKHRKAEKTGGGFVYGGAYHVISLAMTTAVIGVLYIMLSRVDGSYEGNLNVKCMITAVSVALVVYVIFELIRKKGFKRFWASVLRFSGTAAVCVAFLYAAELTEGFGFSNALPSAGRISEVAVTSVYIYTKNGPNVYTDKEAISALLSEHKKLQDSDSELYTGNMLSITYVLNNGNRIKREYGCKPVENNPLQTFSQNIKSLPVYDNKALGFIGDPDYDSINIIYTKHGADSSEKDVDIIIRSSGANELISALKYDLLNNYSADYKGGKSVGFLRFNYVKNGVPDVEGYPISECFSSTIALLEAPDNLGDSEDVLSADDFTDGSIYYVDNYTDKPRAKSLQVHLSKTDQSEAAQELLGYIVPISNSLGIEYSAKISVYENYEGGRLGVKKSDESAALKAMIRLAREQLAEF